MAIFTFKKLERITSRKLISEIFAKGKQNFVFPFKAVYLEQPLENQSFPAQVLITIPKKLFPRAVDRNLLKRRVREAYRLNKSFFYTSLEEQKKYISVVIIYSDKKINDYELIERKIKILLEKLVSS